MSETHLSHQFFVEFDGGVIAHLLLAVVHRRDLEDDREISSGLYRNRRRRYLDAENFGVLGLESEAVVHFALYPRFEVDDVIDLFVSAETGSETGDGTEENPFIRIQQAVDAIPVISGSKYVIWIESGRYLEDIVIESKRVKDITLKSVNYTTINAIEADTDVFVRSVSITNTDNYVLIGGITFVDQANTQAMYGTVKAAIAFDLSKYVSIQSCRFAENTVARGTSYSAIIGGATMCSFGGDSYMGNQSCCFSARAGTQALVSSAVEGLGSTTGFLANQAVVRIASGNRLQATTLKSENNGGQVLGV